MPTWDAVPRESLGAARRPAPWSPRRRRRFALVALVALVGVVLVRALVATPVRVESASMQPTFAVGDVVLVGRTPPDVDDVRRGDLVTFVSPQDGRVTLKRVLGLPGEALVILDGVLFVDGLAVAESYVDHELVDGYFSKTFTVPPDAVFVLGDNRGNSIDSRDYGAVPAWDLLGRVVVRIWPPRG